MDRQALRGFLSIGFFIGGAGFLLAWVQPRDSAEFIVSLCSGGLGLALIALVLIAQRFMQ